MTIKRRCTYSLLILICLMVGLSNQSSSSQTQTDQVAPREDDERPATIEQRQQLLATVLAEANKYRTTGDLLRAASSMNRVARLRGKLHQPDEALSTYREVLELVRHLPGSAAEIDSLNGMAAIYAEKSKCDESKTALQKARALSERSGYVAGEAEALLVLSDCQNHDDHALALKTAQQSLTLWQSVNSKWGMAKTYEAIGHYQFSQNDLIASTQSHEASLNLWRELGIAAGQAESFINLGFIEYRRGAWQSSLSFLSQAQGLIDEKAEPFKMGQIAGGLAEAFIETGLPEQGLVKLKQATEYFRRAQSPRAELVMFWDAGRAYYLLGNYSEALVNLNAGFTGGQSLGEPMLAALCSEHLGRTYVAMNEFPKALSQYQWALDQYRKVSSPMEAARTQALMGQLYQRQGKVDEARNHYQDALGTFRTLSDRLNESATLYGIGSLELQQNNLDLAQNYLQQSIEATESIRRVSTSNDLTAAFSATVQERYETYIDCLMRKDRAQPGQGLAVHAFETSELARARSLIELLRATQTNLVSGLDPQLAEKEKSLRQALRVKEDAKVALMATDYKPEELSDLESELAGLDSEYKQVSENIRTRYPAYHQITHPTAWKLKQIQEEIVVDDETVLLEYSIGVDKSYLWVVTRNDISSYELPKRAVITEAAQKTYEALTATPGAEGAKELAAIQELARLVLSPAASRLNKRHIIVVADGALNYIPFQVLPSPSNSNEPLIANHEVINAPSASILGQLRMETRRRQAPARVLAAFGDPIFASNYAQRRDSVAGEEIASARPPEDARWQHALRDIEVSGDAFDPANIQPLIHTRRELANLRDVAGAETFVATGFDATREQLERMDLAKYSILHFATHGVLDPKRPENSGLFLSMVNRAGEAANGFIGLQDIYALHAPVDLVVLSACRTGLGKDVRGEGLIGLTRGFMYAGASSVVASLWKVDDEATAELMKHFYTNLLQHGMTPAAALRQAQNTIRQQPHWSSPYFWAAFTLQGDYTRVIQAPRASFAKRYLPAVLVVTALAMLAGAGWWYRRRRMARTS